LKDDFIIIIIIIIIIHPHEQAHSSQTYTHGLHVRVG
jgi:hypothetical protein